MKTLGVSVLSISLLALLSLSHVQALLVPLERLPLRRVGDVDINGPVAAETIVNKEDTYVTMFNFQIPCIYINDCPLVCGIYQS